MKISLANHFVAALCAAFIATIAPAHGKPSTPAERVVVPEWFNEPLVAATSALETDTTELLKVVEIGKELPIKQGLDSLLKHVDTNSSSSFAPAVYHKLGIAYYHLGYFTPAIDAWTKGWALRGTPSDIGEGRLLIDGSYGELCRMKARLGLMTELEPLIAQRGDRVLSGPGVTLFEHAQDGLVQMQNLPELSFRCGPLALNSIGRHLFGVNFYNEKVEATKSTTSGISLKVVQDLAKSIDLNYVAVKRTGIALPALPALVHWKIGHYAAITATENDKILVVDPTFGQSLWITIDALNAESSGYFLIPAASRTNDFALLNEMEAESIWGKGTPAVYGAGNSSPCANSSGGSAQCPPAGCGSGGTRPASPAMPRYTLTTMLASLSIADTPVGYQPNYGPEVHFNMHYNHREAEQPVTFPFSNLGHKWSFNWSGHVADNPTSIAAGLKVYLQGGGHEEHVAWYPSENAFVKNVGGTARVHRISENPPVYERREADGWKQVFSRVESNNGSVRRILITEVVDPQGFNLTFGYDGANRLVSVTDAQGRVTQICYEANCGSTSDNKIRKVTDPYGRSATITYNTNGKLDTVTDIYGLTSYFEYDGDFIHTVTTPYGDTHFSRETNSQNPQARWVEAMDANGDRERVEYVNSGPFEYELEMDDRPTTESGFQVTNAFQNARMSYFWGKEALKVAGPCHYLSATWTHFLHDYHQRTGDTIEWSKKPLEGRVFFNYPSQYGPALEGFGNRPSAVARRLDDGTDQITRMQYNNQFNPTKYVDPVGRTTSIEYDTTGFHVNRIIADLPTSAVLAEVEYNSLKLPTKVIDASGEEYTATYNAFGQMTSSTDPEMKTSTLEYSTTGVLTRIVDYDTQSYVDINYNLLDQVASVKLMPENYTLLFEYDAAGRETRTIFPDGTFEESVYDRLDVIAVRDRMGRWTQMTYNNLGQLATVTNPAGEMVQMNWCGCGTVDRLVDAEGRITSWYRDIQGRVTREERADLSKTDYVYENKTSRLKAIIDNKNQRSLLTYNRDNTPATVSVDQVATGTASVPMVSIDWDPYFRRVSDYSDGQGTTNIGYVPYNTSDSTYGDGGVAFIDGPWANDTITYVYDELGRKTQRQINGSANSVSVVYDSVGRVDSITNPLSTFQYAYSPHTNRLTGLSSLDGGESAFNYQSAMNDFTMHKIEHTNASGAGLSKFQYVKDKVGRITDWVQQDGSGTSETFRAKYDLSERLTEWAKSDASNGTTAQWNWRFDKAGNRLNQQFESVSTGLISREESSINIANQVMATESGGALHMSGTLNEPGKITNSLTPTPTLTNADNSFSAWLEGSSTTGTMVEISDWEGNTTSVWAAMEPRPLPAREYEYDGNGNTVRVLTTATDGVTTSEVAFEWDARNQLVAVNIGTHRSEFTYDGLGRRVKIVEKENNVTQSQHWFVWVGLSIAEERDVSGVPRRLIYGQGEIWEGDKFFFAKDHLGSVRQVSHNGTTTIGSYEYDAYGNFTGSGHPEQNLPQLYTGHFFHVRSGLYLAPFRAYDSVGGKWLSRDPIGIAGGINLYGYVGGNPVNWTDPLGFEFGDFFDIGATIAYYDEVAETSTNPFAASGAALASFGLDIFGAKTAQQLGFTYADPCASMGDKAKVTGELALHVASNTIVGFKGAGALIKPKYIYHFTTVERAKSIAAAGMLVPGKGLFGTGVYGSSSMSPLIGRLQGAHAAEAMIRISTKGLTIVPNWIPGSYIIKGVVAFP